MQAMSSTCFMGLEPGTKVGSSERTCGLAFASATAKVTRIITVNRPANPTIRCAAARLPRMHRRATRRRASTEIIASTRYTSYPKTWYLKPTWNVLPRKYRAKSGKDVALAHSIAA